MSETAVTYEGTKAVATVEKIDNGKPALYNPAAFDQIWRAAKLFSSSDLVPTAYKGKPENCFIAIEMADRMGISPFAMLQSLVIIQGKPSMEAKLIIALVNDSGIFKDPLEYEISGDDPHADNYKVRAFATMQKSGKLCQGPWITYKMVKGEGWLDKGGSKWKTMPAIMFMYRAASFFAKMYCPNITMGMQTREEMEDVTSQPIDITPRREEAPPLVALPAPAASVATAAEVIDAPPLAAVSTVIVDGESVDTATGEVTQTETPAEKEKRTRRTKAEMEAARKLEEDAQKATESANQVIDEPEQAPHPADEEPVQETQEDPDAGFPPLPGTVAAPTTTAAPAVSSMGDLF